MDAAARHPSPRARPRRHEPQVGGRRARDGDAWRRSTDGQVPTALGRGPGRGRRRSWARSGRRVVDDWPAIASLGHRRARACTTRSPGTTRFLVNMPGDWAGVPVAGPVAASARPARAPDQRRPGVRAGGAAAGRRARGVVDGRPDAGHRRRRRHRGRRPGPPGPRRHGRRGRPPDDRPGRAAGATAATAAASRPSRGPTGSRRRAGRRPAEAGGRRGRARATRGRSTGWPTSVATSGIGIANMVTVISPDRVVIGGGIAAAGDLLLAPDPRRARAARPARPRSSAVELVTAELGTWAGAIGAAVHGAERAAAARDRSARS